MIYDTDQMTNEERIEAARFLLAQVVESDQDYGLRELTAIACAKAVLDDNFGPALTTIVVEPEPEESAPDF